MHRHEFRTLFYKLKCTDTTIDDGADVTSHKHSIYELKACMQFYFRT
jgi:hypothetical protein